MPHAHNSLRGPFGAPLFYIPETPSTNDLARDAAEAGAVEGTTYVAGAQTAGRGRLGRTWFSPPGAGLYVSTLIRRPALIPWASLAAGVAVADGIREATGLPVQLKWPNDIVAVGARGFANRRKLCGILCEASSGATGVLYLVVGFGINVLTAAYPPELSDRATSIESELGRAVESDLVLAGCIAAVDRVFERVTVDGAAWLLPRWLELAPSARGSRVEWQGADARRNGVTAGIDADGALLVRTEDRIERVLAGEVTWLP